MLVLILVAIVIAGAVLAKTISARNTPAAPGVPMHEKEGEAPRPPIDARTLRRFVPPGTLPTDYVIPCPDCGWNTAVSRAWMLRNELFVCPRCQSATHLIKSANAGPGAITSNFEESLTKIGMPEPLTTANVDTAIAHIAQAYGLQEHDAAHDEAADKPPEPPRRKPRTQPPGARLVAAPHPEIAARPAVLAKGLRIPATITYGRGHHAGQRREIIITSVLGVHSEDGAFLIQSLKAVCGTAKQFRCFTITHITELIDGETGEVAKDPKTWLTRKLAALV